MVQYTICYAKKNIGNVKESTQYIKIKFLAKMKIGNFCVKVNILRVILNNIFIIEYIKNKYLYKTILY